MMGMGIVEYFFFHDVSFDSLANYYFFDQSVIEYVSLWIFFCPVITFFFNLMIQNSISRFSSLASKISRLYATSKEFNDDVLME